MRVVAVRPLLVFDALLNVLVVGIELTQLVIGAIAGVVISDDAFQRLLFRLRIDLVVLAFLNEVFLQLFHFSTDVGGW